MARRRLEKVDPKKTQALLEIAAKEFATFGYEAASINRILENAGLSKGAFYYYFEDKADLAATVLRQEATKILDSFGGFSLPQPGESFWPAMERMQRAALATLERFPQQTELLTKLAPVMATDPKLAADLAPFIREATERAVSLWRRGQQLGEVRSDLSAEQLVAILQSIKQALVRLLLPPNTAPSSAQLDHLAALQMDLFRRVAASPPSASKEP